MGERGLFRLVLRSLVWQGTGDSLPIERLVKLSDATNRVIDPLPALSSRIGGEVDDGQEDDDEDDEQSP